VQEFISKQEMLVGYGCNCIISVCITHQTKHKYEIATLTFSHFSICVSHVGIRLAE